MKKLMFILLSLVTVTTAVRGAHNFSYFVYVETQFSQGFWKNNQALSRTEGTYLYPYKYTDLMGTIRAEFYKKVLERLEEHHSFYEAVQFGDNELKQEGYREYYDTLNFITSRDLPDNQKHTLKNELTATVLQAGECKAIRIEFNGKEEEVYTMDDLDYPLFDLVPAGDAEFPQTKIVEKKVRDTVYKVREDTATETRKNKEAGDREAKKPETQTFHERYLWITIVAALVVLILIKRKKLFL